MSESRLELHFSEFRKNVVGLDQTFMSPYGEKKIIYAGLFEGPVNTKPDAR